MEEIFIAISKALGILGLCALLVGFVIVLLLLAFNDPLERKDESNGRSDDKSDQT